MTHVYPINDLKEHTMNEFCECKPKIEDGICIHNAFDMRDVEEFMNEKETI